ncbi:ankyrin repeat domain-containing protein [Nocardia brasiliensis]|uniref:ankyrin repeat domain-containing protein n=1 Tax=Nocardia brasiliensis TaxID=37326 RepID=UPI002454293B|nr:ankyrin repeat domain-containing protein [Nocardia brasiliensis]
MIAFTDPAATRLAAAIARDDDRLLRQLLAAGADLDATGTDGIGLLGWAVVRLRRRPFSTLLDAGADIGYADNHGDSVMHYAAIAPDHWYLDVLLNRQHIEPDLGNSRTGRTPLMDAILHQRHAQIELLLAAGADPNNRDHGGELPLHLAAEIDDYPSILALLRAGANPDLRNHQGATFQRYLAMTPSSLFTTQARDAREELVTWLDDHNITVDKGLSER